MRRAKTEFLPEPAAGLSFNEVLFNLNEEKF